MRRIFTLFIAAVFLAAHPVAAMSKAAQTFHISSEAIGVKTLQYVDAKRDRPVAVELWYPAAKTKGYKAESPDLVWIHPKEARDAPIASAKGKVPLILMSHGHRGDRRERSWLADLLVRQGYIVASVEHFGNTWNAFNPIISLRFWERVKDVSFALDRVLEEPMLKDRIDLDRVGFVGYSLGGMTGLGLAGAVAKNTKGIALTRLQQEIPPAVLDQIDFAEAEKDYRESRIRSMVLICPANFIYPPESLSQIKIPIGLIAAINDEVLPHQDHADQIIKYLSPHKLKVMRKEISHYAFLNKITEMGKKLLHKAIQNDPPCCDRASVHKEVGTFAIEFFKETL